MTSATSQSAPAPHGVRTPEVSVVIPVHGDRGDLSRTLVCLAAQQTDRSFEVLVVDNGNNPGIQDVVREWPDARLLEEPVPGSYRARNLGVAAAHGAVLAFTDADCLPAPTWLEEGVRALEAHGPGCFAGGRTRMVVEHGERPGVAELWQLGHDLRQDLYVTERGWAATASLFVRAEDFRRTGLFRGGMESGGDREWGERATATGLRPVYADAAVLDHPARATMAQLHRKIARVTRGAVSRQLELGVPVHPHGLVRALLPSARSSWRSSSSVATDWPTRLRFTAVSVWIQYYRTAYGLWLLHHRRAGRWPSPAPRLRAQAARRPR